MIKLSIFIPTMYRYFLSREKKDVKKRGKDPLFVTNDNAHCFDGYTQMCYEVEIPYEEMCNA